VCGRWVEEEGGRHYSGKTEMKRCEMGQIVMPPKSLLVQSKTLKTGQWPRS